MARKKLKNVGVEDEDVLTHEGDGWNTPVEPVDMRDSNPDPDESATVVEDEPAPEAEEAELSQSDSNVDPDDAEKIHKRELKRLKRELGDLGVAYGAGKTSKINVAQKVTEVAMTGAINVTDATDLYKAFSAKAEAKATLASGVVVPEASLTGFDEKLKKNETSEGQQASKLGCFIKLGNAYSDSVDGALNILERAIDIHVRLLAGDKDLVKKGSTYNHLVDIAREQVSPRGKNTKYNGVPMSDEEIETFLSNVPKDKTPMSAARKIEQALAACNAAVKGGEDWYAVDGDAYDHVARAIGDLRAALALEDPAAAQAELVKAQPKE